MRITIFEEEDRLNLIFKIGHIPLQLYIYSNSNKFHVSIISKNIL